MIDKSEYIFPFDTCEKPKSKYFAQPYSVTINCLSTFIVLYFLYKTQTLHAFILFFSLLLFDLSHTFSHFVHIKPGVQITLVHVLAYFLNFSFFYALYKYTKKKPSITLIIFLIIVLSFDIYAYFNLSLLYYIFTQIIFFFAIFIYYYSSLPQNMKQKLNILLIIIGIIYIGFINEAYNCKRMLEKFPNFPFHAIIEILILCAVYIFSITFYNI
jgi:hypothetical protein